MDNEATKVLENGAENVKNDTCADKQDVDNKSKLRGRAAAAAVGAAVGSGAVYAAGQMLAEGSDEVQAEVEAAEVVVEDVNAATVDDSLSFADAFAAAREQVGPGGVFEWHGRLYGTYNEDEWNAMSADERAAWQASTGQASVNEQPAAATAQVHATAVNTPHAEPAAATVAETPATEVNTVSTNQGASQASTGGDNEVHVVGVAIQDNGQGGIATIASLQAGDEMAVVVDVDTDGTIDLIGIDQNHNGQLGNDEWQDVSGQGLQTGDVVGAYVAEARVQGVTPVVTDLGTGQQYQLNEENGQFEVAAMDDGTPTPDTTEASNGIADDGMPDYMNDADAGFMDA